MAQTKRITAEQLVEIEKTRKENKDKTVECRLNVLVLRAKGKSLAEIAEATGYHYAYVSTVIAKYLRDGLESVTKSNYHGDYRNISYKEEAAVLAPFKALAEKGQLVEI